MNYLKLCLSVSATLLAFIGSMQASTSSLSPGPLAHHQTQDHWLEILDNETIQSDLPLLLS